MSRYLLDTNIVIALFARETSVMGRLAQEEETYISAIVLGELYFVAQRSARVSSNLERVNRLVQESSILTCDLGTARQYGMIQHKLMRKGRPIPENDIWIAATALQHDLVLVTRDHHFNEIEGLKLERW